MKELLEFQKILVLENLRDRMSQLEDLRMKLSEDYRSEPSRSLLKDVQNAIDELWPRIRREKIPGKTTKRPSPSIRQRIPLQDTVALSDGFWE